MISARLPIARAVLTLLALSTGLLLACGSQEPSSPAALTELERVANVKPGRPVLVFVYTDG